MRFKQIEDILSWVTQFHADLEAKFREFEEGNASERVVLLLEYLADHEHTLATTIAQYQAEASPQILHTWFNQTPEVDSPEKLKALSQGLSGVKTTEDVVNLSITCHDLFIDMYKDIQMSCETSSAKDLFQSLIELEQHDKIRMVRDAGRFEDI